MAVRFNWLIGLFFCFAQSIQAAAPPSRIVSMNLCADQLLLLLAEPNQIAALTQLSHDPDASYYQPQALRYPINKGLAEEILPFKPDLVINGEYGHAATVQLLQKLGIHVATLPMANTLDDVFKNLRQIGALVGQQARAEIIIQQMQNRLNQLQPAPQHTPLAAIYDANGYTEGNASLRGQMLSKAGWQNAAERAGINSYGRILLEDLIRLKPEVLIESPYRASAYSRAQALTQHPALKRGQFAPRIINVPSKLTICEGPWMVDVIEQLQAERIKLGTNKAH